MGAILRRELPRGPANLVGTFLRYLADPNGAFAAVGRKYGDPFFLPMGPKGTVVTGDPAGIKAIMGSDPDTFESFRTEATISILGARSLFFQSGRPHRAARRMLSGPFHGPRLRSWGRLIEASARRRIAALPVGARFNLQQLVQWVALDVIIPAVFGVTDPARVAVFHQVVYSGFDRVGPAVLNFKLLRHEFGGVGPWARVQRMVRALNRLTAEEIAARRARPAEGEPGDVLGALLEGRYEDGSPLSDDEIRDKLFDMLIAGYETSAIALAWAGYEICRDARVEEQVRAELASTGPDPDFDGLLALPYLDDVCQETLRLHPVFVLLTRQLARPLEMKGYHLPVGLGVSAAIGSVHHREDIYPEPHAFDPSRFRGRTYSPFEYLPFGGGAQRCLGAAFATYQMKIILATLLRSVRLRVAAERPVHTVARAATVAPAGGVPMVVLEHLRDRPSLPASRAPDRPAGARA